MDTKLTPVTLLLAIFTGMSSTDGDSLSLCELVGGSCKVSCDRELRHRWGISMCGEDDLKCCADPPGPPDTTTSHGLSTVEQNECLRNGGSCYAWYHFSSACLSGTSSVHACDHLWSSCCVTSSTDAPQTTSVQTTTEILQSTSSSTTQTTDHILSTSNAPELVGCGRVTTSRRRKRVVGGLEATANRWPWHVAIRTPLGNIHCAGTIISDQWILTAAHCFEQSAAPLFYRIVVGSDISESSIASDRQLQAIFMHPDYDEIEEVNAAEGHAHRKDIALIKLSSSLNFDSSVQPACLPEADFQAGHREHCWLAGWGSTGNRAGSVIRLRHVRDRVMNSTQCASHWPSGEITDNMICFGNAQRGACQGDSGGGMYCQKEDGSYQVSGIISWGDLNCNSRPTVLTNVSKYLTWIEEVMSNN